MKAVRVPIASDSSRMRGFIADAARNSLVLELHGEDAQFDELTAGNPVQAAISS